MNSNIFVYAAIASVLWYGSLGIYHGAKKVAHKVGCVIVHGKTCIK